MQKPLRLLSVFYQFIFTGLFFLVLGFSGRAQNDPCHNVDFNTGTFDGWRLGIGCQPAPNRGGILNQNNDWPCTDPDNAGCCPNVGTGVIGGDVMDREARHSLCQRGNNDPYMGADLPMVPPPLDGFPVSNWSVRLGNARRFAQAESLERTFLVDSANALFVYEFAFVLNDPSNNHATEELPFFEIFAYGADEDDKVPCSHIRFESNADNLDVKNNVPNNDPDKINDLPWKLTYQKWSVAFLDLTDRIGEEVTIKVMNADCALTGHFGYTYFVAHCMPFIPTKDVSVCAGESVTLKSPWPLSGYKIEWLENGVIFSNADEVTVTPTATTKYTVKATNKYKDDSSCNNELEVTVKVGEGLPPVLENQEVCAGEAVTLVPEPQGINYEWYDAAAGGNLINTGDRYVTPALFATTTYYVVNPAACAPKERVPVTVVIKEISADAGPDVSICQGSSTQLNATGGESYEWFPRDGLNDAKISNPTASPSIKTTYVVKVTDASGVCVAWDTVVVDVGEIIADAGPDATICLGDSTQLNASEGDIYVWTPVTGLSNTNTSNPKASPPVTTTYVVTVRDDAGLCEDSDTVVVNVEDVVAKLEGLNVCIGFPTSFTNLTTPINLSNPQWLWDFGDGNQSTEKDPIHTYQIPGRYNVLLSAKAGNCADTSSTEVEVYPNPVAAFTPTPRKTTADDPSITFIDESIDAAKGTWDFGDNMNDVYEPGSNKIHVYYATNEAKGPFKYTITLSVESEHGCLDEVSHPIEIENIWTIYVPNSFTPDGDGINDYFKAYGIGIMEFKMTVFNRWGEAVYRSDDINEGWDGTPISGNTKKQEVYVWKVKATNNKGKTIKLIGHVSLLPGPGNN